MRDRDQNDESALKVGPNHQCLQQHVPSNNYDFSKNPKSALKTSISKGRPKPTKLVQNGCHTTAVIFTGNQ